MTVRIIAAAIGGLLGFAYYHFIGCRSGSCPITGNPYISVLWGAILGFLISG
ncbi:MAG TPA: YtxH domain-containing protein [Candidatus Marinimicrobia bacterium]|nr:YtxH domain-containing protein [Candidatus Neomarinimicrobiota bacterium]